ncbi:5HT3A protein, partial [Polyodon spathula]|nr:5HT3A protein [Polyodon spathula]
MRFYKTFQPILDTPGMRPSSTWRQPTHINLSINIKEIIGVDEKTHILITFVALRQLWFNEFLVWDPSEFDGMDHLNVPVEFIWTPDFYIYELQVHVGEDLSPFIPYLYLHHDGQVIHDQPIRAVTSCNLDIFYFPFDTHSCILTFGPYLHTGGYFLVCMALLVASLLESIFISNVLHRKSLQGREVPSWVRTLVLHKLAQMICYKKKESSKHQAEESIYTIHSNKNAENPVWKISSQKPACTEIRILTFLKKTCEDVQVMRDTLKNLQARKKSSKEWVEVSCVLDILLLRLYILFIALTSLCLCILWSHWYRV